MTQTKRMLGFVSSTLFVLMAVATVSAYASFPQPFELSFEDEFQKPCNHPQLIQPKKIIRDNVSLCFDDLEDTAENVLQWRMMFTSIQLENKTTLVDLKVRRVRIFAPGASITMAGNKPVSVFSRFRELEIGIHYNGYGKVSDSANSSVIFKGQLNTTVFEGQVIYQNLNRSHTVQCLHDNSLQADFYQNNDCLACSFTTYDTHHNPDFPVGWRSGGHSPCRKSHSVFNHSRHGTFTNKIADDEGSKGQNSSDFPPTGFSEYRYTANNNKPTLNVNKNRERKKNSAPSFATQKKTAKGVANHYNSGAREITERRPKPRQGEDISDIENSSGSREASPESDQTSAEVKQFNRGKRSALGDDDSLFSQAGTDSTFPRSVKMPSRRRHSKRDNTEAPRSRHQKTTTSGPHPEPSAQHSYTKTISCPLHLVADHLFFSEIGEKSPAKTVNLMLSVVIGADAVFRGTDFDGDGKKDNIGFMVKNITIIHNSSVAFYQYSRTNGNSFYYLKSFSTGDFSDVCLGVAFTAIDFQRGVVGLAWYASSGGGGAGKGGICGQRVYLPNEGSSFSFNTAIVSFLNHGSSVSMEKAILTLAHELGHCFGSSHDDMAGSPCNKVYAKGAYLMQKYRPAQYLPNNYKFSPCSLRQMYPVISQKGGCLIRYTGPTCGNGVVEEGEECDCGLSGVCQYNDPCCTPGDAPHSSADPPCTVRRSQGMDCSPATFSCCSHGCKHISLADRYVCRQAGDCYSQASCDGQGPHCPASAFHPDGTPCHGAVRACLQGRCGQSLCTKAGLEDCFCKDSPEDRCKLCCRRAYDSQCRPAKVFNITSSLGHVLYLPEGDGCLDYRGVCTLSSSKKMVCKTTEDLDGEFSELIGLQSGRSSGSGLGLYGTWFYFILIPLVFVVTSAVLFYGRTMFGKFRSMLNGSRTGDSTGKLLAVVTGAQNQSAVVRSELAKTSALGDSMSSPLTAKHQHQFQWQRHGFRSPNAFHHQRFGRQYKQERREGANNRARNIHYYPRQRHDRALSMRKVGFKKRHGRNNLKRSLSVFDSILSETSELSLPDYQNQRRGMTIPNAHTKPQSKNTVNQNNSVFNTEVEHHVRHPQTLGSSRRRLRAKYSKPCIRTPLQRRRTLPNKTALKYMIRGPTANDARSKYMAKNQHLISLSSSGLSDLTMSRRKTFRHKPLRKSLSSASSENY